VPASIAAKFACTLAIPALTVCDCAGLVESQAAHTSSGSETMAAIIASKLWEVRQFFIDFLYMFLQRFYLDLQSIP
jgi:hypothetical protein